MSCVACGSKDVDYTVNGYGLCRVCLESVCPIYTPKLPEEIKQEFTFLYRLTLASACLGLFIIAAGIVMWLGGK